MSRKRVSIYLVCIIVFVALTLVKQNHIHSKRNRPIVSIFDEWQEHGKPVTVGRIVAKDVPVYTKLTVWPVSDNRFETYVSKRVQQTIQQGQSVCLLIDNKEVSGKILQVSKEISLDTGMYRVQLEFAGVCDLESWVVVFVQTKALEKVIWIPNNIIETENGEVYVWKIKEGHAVKQPIKIGERNGYGAVVLEGLCSGDLVVYKGVNQLFEDELVTIIEEIENVREEI
jgi:hypothetical protein